jgi:hypothetical protein
MTSFQGSLLRFPAHGFECIAMAMDGAHGLFFSYITSTALHRDYIAHVMDGTKQMFGVFVCFSTTTSLLIILETDIDAHMGNEHGW